MAGDFSLKDAYAFLIKYYFNKLSNEKSIPVDEFWSITYGIIRKLNRILDEKNLGVFRQKLKTAGTKILGKSS